MLKKGLLLAGLKQENRILNMLRNSQFIAPKESQHFPLKGEVLKSSRVVYPLRVKDLLDKHYCVRSYNQSN